MIIVIVAGGAIAATSLLTSQTTSSVSTTQSDSALVTSTLIYTELNRRSKNWLLCQREPRTGNNRNCERHIPELLRTFDKNPDLSLYFWDSRDDRLVSRTIGHRLCRSRPGSQRLCRIKRDRSGNCVRRSEWRSTLRSNQPVWNYFGCQSGWKDIRSTGTRKHAGHCSEIVPSRTRLCSNYRGGKCNHR